MIIIIFLLMNAFFIVSNKNIPLNSIDNISEVSVVYISWVQNIGKNLGEISGNVVKLEWVPDINSQGK